MPYYAIERRGEVLKPAPICKHKYRVERNPNTTSQSRWQKVCTKCGRWSHYELRDLDKKMMSQTKKQTLYLAEIQQASAE